MTGAHALVPATIPSPTQGVWDLGFFPVRAYALCILLGIVVAIWLGDRRWRRRGGREGQVLDIAAWAVPFGIVGGRLYHVATSWQPYFGPGGHPVQALYVWEGGLGIWGAITLGGLGAYIGARRAGILMPPLTDALAPGIVLAQAIGRWGNWFNNELYGGPTTLPWGLQIHQWDAAAGHAVTGPDGRPVVLGTFHPTFLYESLWDAGTAALLIVADRRFKLGHGRVFALYVLVYTVGRGWIEALRVDPANHILGLRLNLWTSLLVGLGALIYLVLSFRRRPGREASVVRGAPDPGASSEPSGGPRSERGDDRADGDDEDADAGDAAVTARWRAWLRTRPGGSRDDTAPDAKGDTEPDTEGDAEGGTEPATEPDTEPDTESDTGPDAEHDTGTGTGAGHGTGPGTEPDRARDATRAPAQVRAGHGGGRGSGDPGPTDTLP